VIGGKREFVATARGRAVDDGDKTLPEFSLESSKPLRVSLVNLQKLTLWAWVAPASMRMLAPAQNTRFLPERTTTTFTPGCSKRSRCTASGQFDIDAEVVGNSA